MKKNLSLILFAFLPLLVISQIPQAFNYQAVVRGSDGKIQYDAIADFKIEILQNGNTVYTETHDDKNTGKTGVVNFKVGLGTDPIGDFPQIDWSQGDLKIRVHLKLDSGQEEEMGLADIVAVPFALYAQNSGNNYWNKLSDNIYYDAGNVGIGVSDPSNPLEVVGSIRVTGSTTDGKFHMIANNADQDNRIRSDDQDATTMWNLIMGHRVRNDNFNIDRVGNGKTDFVINTDGYIGLNTYSPEHPLDIYGMSHYKIGMHAADNVQQNMIRSFDQAGNQMWVVSMGDRTSDNKFVIDRPGPGDVCTDFYIDNNSHTHVNVLEIHGGCDIKEDLSSVEKLEPGDVVVIDEKNPGQIRRTNEEYDRKVAGIISGANGINPGISLSQDDVLEGEFPLTMLGRVYVKVTGKVEIGDMLTTSTKSGYAMSVQRHSKAHGAVIGKAMTSLEGGEGMVLVLVNLQ